MKASDDRDDGGRPPATVAATASAAPSGAAGALRRYPPYRRELRSTLTILAALAGVQLGTLWLPVGGPAADVANYLSLHTLLETISIVISLMVFAVGWNSSGREVSRNVLVLACAFLTVGALDFSHMASYVGMPDFGTPNDAQKHLNFWLAARLIASSSLLLLVLRPAAKPANPRTRYALLGGALCAVALANWVVIVHQPWLPDTFVSGAGLTPFKKTVEYLVIGLSLATAAALLGKLRAPQSFDPVLLLGAVCAIAMSEIYLTVYTTMTGPYNLLGHIYKVVGYLFIYRAIVAEAIDRPYENIEKANAKFTNIFESVSDGIELLSLEGRIIDLNRAAHERLGRSKRELLGRRLADLCLPEHADQVLRRCAVVALHESVTFESSRIGRDGSAFPVEISARRVEMDDQPLLLCISRDISERKRVEGVLLRESEKNLAILRNASDGIHILDADGTLLEASDSFCTMLGYSRGELVGMRVWQWDDRLDESDLRARLVHAFANRLRAQFESVHRRKDGTRFDVEISSLALDLGGKPVLFCSSRDITLRKAAEQEVERLAYYDALTNLPNRRLMLDRLQQAITANVRGAKSGALLLIDLDNFKSINDTLGHAVGDLLLKRVGKRLLDCMRKGDSVARLGGDEFVVILSDLSPLAAEAAGQMESVAAKILAALDRTDHFGAHAYRSTASIGATFFSQSHSAEEHVKQADIAMYQAKQAGRNTLRVFDPAMQESINHRAALESALRGALAGNQFLLHYQVQVDSARRATGFEALLRWQHPEAGLILPGGFIRLAEETLLIVPIGRWVIETACAQLAAWSQDERTRALSVSVNVSAVQIRAADFVAHLEDAVRRHGIEPRRLVLEPTESLFLDDIEEAIATLTAIKRLGVRLALDDFGTGFSSLQYLKRLPLDQLKIDQSFVRDVVHDASDQAIVRTIIAMAHSLGLETIAEGVETEEQRALLLSFGCNHFQGYLFGRPAAPESLAASWPAAEPLEGPARSASSQGQPKLA